MKDSHAAPDEEMRANRDDDGGGDDAPSGEADSASSLEAADPEAEQLAFEVAAEDENARLDAFLAARVAGTSRTTLKRIIDEGEVLVSGVARKASYKLRAGEQVEIEIPPLAPLELEPEDIPLDIIYEDGEIIVVNKPAGLVVHPAAGVARGTLANALAFHLKQQPSPGDLRPGIVHRLDRDTSGLLVAAKTAAAHEHLAEQFRAREVFKLYSALAHGALKEDSGSIEQPIGRDPSKRTRMAVVRRGGREALTHFRVRRRFARFTLLDVEIKTGRTHQIRVHLAWLKHPVVGDGMYNAGRDGQLADAKLRTRINSLTRQFLHATRLGFRHPSTGEWMRFDAPPPADLQSLLDFLEEYYA